MGDPFSWDDAAEPSGDADDDMGETGFQPDPNLPEVDTQGFAMTGEAAEVEAELAAIEDASPDYVTTDPEGNVVTPTGPGLEDALAASEPETTTDAAVAEPAVTPEADSAAVQSAAVEPSGPRRAKGDLGVAVKSVTDEFVAGTWKPTDSEGADEALTPHRIAVRLKERDGLDKAPSTGAITNVIKTWADIGFIVLANDHPLTFGSYIGNGSVTELSGLLALAKSARKAEKDAQKAAAAPAATPAPVATEPEVIEPEGDAASVAV